MTDQEFADATVVVTGGGAHTERALGIGEETVRRFVAEGAEVVVADVDRAMCERTVDAVDEAGPGEAVPVETDVTDWDSVAALAATCEELGGIDVLVNNAGIRIPEGPLSGADPADIERIVSVNLVGMMRSIAALVPLIDEGAVVNVASANASRGRPGWAPYDAAKAGVLGLTRDAACDYAPDIRVNAVAPGWTVTDYHIERGDRDPETFLEEETSPGSGRNVLGRGSHPREQAAAVRWLASEESSFVTGTTLYVDGGYHAGQR